jgi:DNA-binding response OmpR family regulator
LNKLHKLIVMDDDPHFAGMLALNLQQRFPELVVTTIDKSEPVAGYDIYILDNDFRGEKHGALLAEQVRKQSPSSLVIMLSATLELALLKRLVNCHAAGVFDKSEPDEMERMMRLIDAFICSPIVTPKKRKESFKNTVASVTSLLKEWNHRLEFEKGN